MLDQDQVYPAQHLGQPAAPGPGWWRCPRWPLNGLFGPVV
jgi:hypothetical protein